ncbi:hypothetical protein GYMLUDRAFT_239622 [Collybiopsis luxurians FD-317 M1]|nr:hypothetical protein GYMLUDRAFT_239622 [Collybiopsis luxurians FD-317 M1]
MPKPRTKAEKSREAETLIRTDVKGLRDGPCKDPHDAAQKLNLWSQRQTIDHQFHGHDYDSSEHDIVEHGSGNGRLFNHSLSSFSPSSTPQRRSSRLPPVADGFDTDSCAGDAHEDRGQDDDEELLSSTSSSGSSDDNLDLLSKGMLKIKLRKARRGKRKYRTKYLHQKDILARLVESAQAHATLAASLSLVIGSRIVALSALHEAAKVQREKAEVKKAGQVARKQAMDDTAAFVRITRLNVGRGNMVFTESLGSLRLQDLRNLCWNMRLDETGTKETLKARVAEYFEAHPYLRVAPRYVGLFTTRAKRLRAASPTSQASSPPSSTNCRRLNMSPS